MRGPEYSTAIGLLMESLKINEKQESIEIQNKKEEEAPKPVVEATPELVEAKPENVSAAAPQKEKKETWSVRFMKKIQEFLEAGES